MSGVNDLAERWNQEWIEHGEPKYHVHEVSECANELEDVARTAWHPISELPTEEDGDPDGEVLLWLGADVVDQVHYSRVYARGVMQEDHDQWARIRDVVLFPIGYK